MVGNTKRHASEASIIASKDFYRYNVVKINTSGFKQRRILTIDAQTTSLWNFNTKMKLKKQVPLSQLVQVRSCFLLTCTGTCCPCISPLRVRKGHL